MRHKEAPQVLWVAPEGLQGLHWVLHGAAPHEAQRRTQGGPSGPCGGS